MQVPSVLPRMVRASGTDKTASSGSSCLEEIIERNIGQLFLNYDIDLRPSLPDHAERGLYASTRMRQQTCLKEIQKQLKKRQWGEVIRLERSGNGMDNRLLKDPEKRTSIFSGDDIFTEIAVRWI